MKEKLTTRLVNSLKPSETIYRVWDTEIKGFFIRVRPSGSMVYCLFYRFNGFKREYTIGKHGTITTAQARDIAGKLAGQVKNGIDVHAEKKIKTREAQLEANELTFKAFLNGPYMEWRTANRKRGVETIQRLNTNFCQALGSLKLKEITAWIVDKWKSGQLKAGKHPATVNRDIGDLKAALSYAEEWGLLENNPLKSLKRAKVDKLPAVRYLEASEEKALLTALDKRNEELKAARSRGNQWRATRGYDLKDELGAQTYADYLAPMIVLCLNTGLRRGELFNLEWKDIHFERKTLTIHGSNAKSGNTRHIPLNETAISCLLSWKQQNVKSGLVFPNPSGQPLNNIKKSWAGILKRASISNFRFHDLRHHFASRLVMSGVDLNTVRELLGHSNIETTLRYAHLAPEHKAAAVAVLDKPKAETEDVQVTTYQP